MTLIDADERNLFFFSSACLCEICGCHPYSRGWRSLGLSAVELEVKQRDCDEGMSDAAGADEVGDFCDGQEGGDQIFAMIEYGWMF